MTDAPVVIEPEVFTDDRGFLFESYNQARLDTLVGRTVRFVQDNHSGSRKGVLRGLHYQVPPGAQGKLVSVPTGEVFDVVVDIRRSSPGFGTWTGNILSETNRHHLWIPPGFAHGFYVLSDFADVVYKMTDYHQPSLDRTIRWDDPAIGIRWPLGDGPPRVSEKDGRAPHLAESEVFS